MFARIGLGCEGKGRGWAWGMMVLVMVADQLSKAVMLQWMSAEPYAPVAVTPFLNIVKVWNHGVSFGMLSHPETQLPWVLIGVAVVMTLGLAGWLHQPATQALTRVAIGLVMGGAVGNVIDRVRFGAVFDFVDVHWMGYHWPAFNVADAAICGGVLLLVWEGVRNPSPPRAGA